MVTFRQAMLLLLKTLYQIEGPKVSPLIGSAVPFASNLASRQKCPFSDWLGGGMLVHCAFTTHFPPGSRLFTYVLAAFAGVISVQPVCQSVLVEAFAQYSGRFRPPETMKRKCPGV